MAQTVLVAGGGGFIGSHTVDALLAEGHRVRILDSFAPPVHRDGRPPDLPSGVEVVEGDVRDKAAWRTALDGVDAVYQLAAYQDYLPDFSTFFDVNTVGTAMLYEVIVEARLPVGRVVVASSQAVYGEGPYGCEAAGCPARGEQQLPDIRTREQLDRGMWDHLCGSCGAPLAPRPAGEHLSNPQNQYALSKHAQERLALTLGSRYDIPTVALRYSIVQGPRQSFHNGYSGACRIFCLSHHFGRAVVVYEDGLQLRDYVDSQDVVAANLLVLTHPQAPGNAFNVGGGRPYTVLEFAAVVAREFGSDTPPLTGREYRFGDTRHIVSDIGRLRSLGWAPKRTCADSVRDYAAWLRRLGDVDDALDEARRRMLSAGVVRRAGRAMEAAGT